MQELLSAVCLAAVLEGLMLLAFPHVWRRAVEQIHALSDQRLRLIGGAVVGLSMVALWLVRW